MDNQHLKRILAGISLAGLLAGTVVGCTPRTQETTESTSPAKEQGTPAPSS